MKKRGLFVSLVAGAAIALCACGVGFTPEDAQNYVQAALDASYKADFEEYVKQTDSTTEEAEEMYQQNIDNILSGIGIEESGVSEELIEQYRNIAPEILSLANYQVTGAEQEEDGFGVEITYKPFVGYNELDTELEAVLMDIAATLEELPSDQEINELVYQEMLKLIQQKLESPSYGEEQNFTIHVEKGSDNIYSISEEDMIALDNAMYSEE